MLEIHSDKSDQFNEYLIKKIKADLKQSAFFFNPVFLFYGKEYSLTKCIDSLTVVRGRIYFKLLYQIKFLIYNNRQLFWITTMSYYEKNLNREYLLWVGKKARLRTMSNKHD